MKKAQKNVTGKPGQSWVNSTLAEIPASSIKTSPELCCQNFSSFLSENPVSLCEEQVEESPLALENSPGP
jgi:hypothetical protein